MSAMHPTSFQLPFEEVVPDSAAVKNLSRSSILTQRRRVRVPAQSGISYGAAGTGGGNRQIQFVVADAGGLLDPSSINLVYNVQTSGGAAWNVVDDGHPFTRVQINLNGNNLEDNAQCAKYTNAEVKLSCGQPWYRNEGSFAGFELLNNELNTGAASVANAAALQAYSGAWGDVQGNVTALAARQGANAYAWNPFGGEQRCTPLGLISGVGRMRQYLPLNVLGELNLTLFTGSPGEVCVQTTGSTDANFSLNAVYLEYDIVIPHPSYAELLHKMANDPSEMGLNMPFESTIMASSGNIASSATLSESSIIVSRATQNLLRSFVIQQPQAMLTSTTFPIQSCFGHAGTFSVQWRIGSQYFPAQPAQGDASMYAMSQLAYGSANQNENGSCINRGLWGQFTTTGVPNVSANEGTAKFAFADSFIPCYGFQVVKGNAEPLAVDGISLSGASGSQAVVVIQSAPSVTITPTVALVALRFISAHAGSVRILGA